MKSKTPKNNPSAFEMVSQFVAALSAQDTKTTASLHAKDFVVDWVYGDAFVSLPSSAEESAAFFPAWFAGFDEIDYDVKRTIAAEEVVVAEWDFSSTDPRRTRNIILFLAICTAPQITSYSMIFPFFARKIGDFGDGGAVLAASVMACSLAGTISGPIMGSLADRFGRRPLILGSFTVFTAAFTGYYLAATLYHCQLTAVRKTNSLADMVLRD